MRASSFFCTRKILNEKKSVLDCLLLLFLNSKKTVILEVGILLKKNSQKTTLRAIISGIKWVFRLDFNKTFIPNL